MLEALIKNCVTAISEAIEDAKLQDEKSAGATVSTADGFVEILIKDNGAKEAIVYHNSNSNESDNIMDAIEAALPDWGDIEAEAETCEFGVDPGFANYQDYLNYKFG